MKMGRRLSRACGIGHVSIQICSALTASPARTACRRPILIATKATLFMGQDSKLADMKSNEQVTIARGQEIDGRSEAVIASQSDLRA